MNIPDEIRDLCEALLDGLNTALGEKLYGVYLYGALAFPEGGATGDIDFHVILYDVLDEQEKLALDELHAVLAQDHPPLGVGLDGYYLLLEEARRTMPPANRCWTKRLYSSRQNILTSWPCWNSGGWIR